MTSELHIGTFFKYRQRQMAFGKNNLYIIIPIINSINPKIENIISGNE